jgi:hypothetical protein
LNPALLYIIIAGHFLFSVGCIIAVRNGEEYDHKFTHIYLFTFVFTHRNLYIMRLYIFIYVIIIGHFLFSVGCIIAVRNGMVHVYISAYTYTYTFTFMFTNRNLCTYIYIIRLYIFIYVIYFYWPFPFLSALQYCRTKWWGIWS